MTWTGGIRQCAAALTACVLILTGSAASRAGPTLLIDTSTGDVLASENADATWFPASLTKLMTAYVVFEAVKSSKIAWNGPLALSDKARGQPATRIGLKPHIPLTIEGGVRGMIMRSANDFSMALAEAIGGSEEGFSELMNATAKRLGMTRTRFANPHGLPDPEQITTARDMAILTLALLKDFPDRAEVFATPQFVIHKGTFHSQNDLMRTFAGADGMKTGFTCGAGYNVVASATRNGRRLIVVVLGAVTRPARSQRAAELLQAGFDHVDGVKPLMEKTTRLADLAMSTAELIPVHDMSRETQTRKCGNRGPRLQVAKAGAGAKKKVEKMAAKATSNPATTKSSTTQASAKKAEAGKQ